MIYSFVSLYFSGKLTDLAMIGRTETLHAFNIISDKYEEISQAILAEMNRGVTGIKSQGMYTKNERVLLYVVVESR